MENEPFSTVAKTHTSRRPFAERVVACAYEEGLLLMKLHALPLLYRQGQLNKVRTDESDVADLLELPSEVSERIWSKLADTLLESDVDELRTIVAGIAAKIAEGGKRFSSGDDA